LGNWNLKINLEFIINSGKKIKVGVKKQNLVFIFTAIFAIFFTCLFFTNSASAATNSNTFYSQVKDMGHANDYDTITWTDYTPANTTVDVSVRAGEDNTPDDGTGNWTSWTAVAKNGSLDAIDGKQYVQYKAVFTYTDTSLTPNLQDITFNYHYFTGTYFLLSSPYNTTDPANAIGRISWNESNVDGTTKDVKFQVRTATNNDHGTPGDPSDDTPNTWFPASGNFCGPDNGVAGTCNESTYFTDPTGLSETIDNDMKGGTSDQWVQYKVYLSATNTWQTPSVQDATMSYVVNAPPVVSGVTASENANGTISIGYSLADSDSSSFTVAASADIGVAVADNPLSSSATSINLSGNYAYLPTGSQTIIIENEQITCTSRSGAVLSGCTRGVNTTTASSHVQTSVVWAKAITATGNIGAGQTTGTGKSITWTIKSDFDGVYRNASQGKIRVTANDGNIANQVGNADSSTFVIDTNNPASPTIYLDRSASAGNVSAKIGITGDAGDSLSYVIDNTQLYNVNDNCAGTACACFGGATTPAGYEAFVTAHSLSWASLNTNPKTFSFTDNNDDARKICVLYKDQFNNYSTNNENLCNGTVCNYAITPQNPYAFKYYDTSNPDTSDYRLVLSWGVPALYGEGKENTYNGFDVYQIYRCHQDKLLADCSNFTAYTTKAKTDNYITDSGLSNSDKYCYKFKLKDHPSDSGGNSSDYSKWSDALCAVPGAGGSSLSKNISIHSSSVPDGTKYATQVTINWDTYDAQDPNTLLTGTSAVYWRDKTLNEQTWNYFSPSGYAEHHSVTIPGGQLLPAHTYEYKVYSQSLWGTEVYYKTSSYDTFQTLAGPVITNVQAIDVGNSGATITWDTDINASSEVYYSTSYLNGQLVSPNTATCPGTYITSGHACTISGLNPGTTYYFSVKSVKQGDANAFAVQNYDITGTFLHFTTTVDYTLPVITPDVNPLILTDTQAALGWSTDKKTKAWILWGAVSHPTPPYTAPIANFDPNNPTHNPYQHYQANSNSDLSHTFVMSLGSLTPDTDYFYRMASQDTSGNVTVSNPESTFHTLPIQVDHTALVNATHDTALTIAQYSDTEAVVTFNAGTTATSKLCYATSAGIDIAACTGETTITNSKIHTYHLSGLTPATPYFVKMKLTDSDNAGDTYTPAEKTFTTQPIQVDHTALNSATHDTDPTVTLKTDTAADLYFNAGTTTTSKLCYAATPGIDIANCTGETAITNSKIHTYHLSGLTPNTPYYVKMKLTDSDNAGDTYTTGEISLTTLDILTQHQDLTNPGDPIVDNFTDTEATVHLPAANTESTSKLCYGTAAIADGSVAACTHHADVTDQTMTHYYHLSSLTPDTTYHLKSKITDSQRSSVFFYSASAPSDITFHTKKIQVDQHAALSTISTPTSSDITTSYNYAYVKWTTDQIANSTLQCGTTHTGPYTMTTSDATGYGKAHALKMTGLAANTDYFCQVISTDDLPSPTTLTSGEFTFKTDKDPEFNHAALTSIDTVSAAVITDTNAAIKFTTDQPALCLAEVTTSSGNYTSPLTFDEDNYIFDAGGNYASTTKFSKDHTIYFTGLLFSTPYYYKLTCHDNLNTIVAEQVNDQHHFATLPQQSNHLVLSGIGTLTVPQYSDTEALVTLPAVNTASTSKLCYSTVSYDDIDIDGTCTGPDPITTPTLTHYYHLIGLTAKTQYYLKIKVTDSTNASISFPAQVDFTTKETPTDHPDLTDPGNPGTLQISDTEATITLPAKTGDTEVSTNTTATSKLCYGTEAISEDMSTTCPNSLEITSPTRLHYYHLANLTPNTPYHIRTQTIDAVHTSISFTSEDITFTTSEKLYTLSGADAEGDHTAPVIKNVSSGTITGESVTITWDTDEKANSLVQYGIKSGVYDSAGANNDVNADVTNFVTAHEVIINNLVPGTKYYFKAMSYDAAGNIGESSENSFTTKATSNISSIKAISTKLGEINITWKTGEKTTSTVEYGETTSYGEIKESGTYATDHEVSITGLKQSIEYHFMVKGKDQSNNVYASGDNSVTPKSPPQINSPKIADLTEHGATITFSTNIPTDSLVTYTATQDQKDTGSQGKPDLATTHSVEIKNLDSGVAFATSIKVRDQDGNETTQAGPNFTTGVDSIPPKIDQVRTDSALAQNNKVQTIISWLTDEPATTSLIYKEGNSGEQKEIKISSAYATSHVAVITIFKPGAVYYFKVKSVDPSENSAVSSDYALLTPKNKENIVQIIIKNFSDIFGWARFGG